MQKGDLRPNWSPRRAKNVKGEKKRRGRGRRRRRRRRDQGQKGMETTLNMDFVWITWNFKAWYG